MKTEETILKSFLREKAQSCWFRGMIRQYERIGEPGIFRWDSIRGMGKAIYEHKTSIIDEISIFKQPHTYEKKTVKTQAKALLTKNVKIYRESTSRRTSSKNFRREKTFS